jgi:exopolysaccharide biosynthesis polyprenyl glycosylphosphotransferase
VGRFWDHYASAPLAVLGWLEAVLVACSCYCAFFLFHPSADTLFLATPSLSAGVFVAGGPVFLMYSGGLYQDETMLSLSRSLSRIAIIIVPVFVIAIVANHVFMQAPEAVGSPWHWRALALTATWLLSAVVLRAITQRFRRSEVLARKVVLLGGTYNHIQELFALSEESYGRFTIVQNIQPGVHTGRKLGDSDARTRLLSGVSEFVIGQEGGSEGCNLTKQFGVGLGRVTSYLDFYEREAMRVSIDNLSADWLLSAPGLRHSRSGEVVGQVMDSTLSLVAIVLAAPVMMLAALAVKLEDGGNILYRQERVGLNGRPYVMLKFRSMREGAERGGVPAWATERDVRITRVGRVIRKLRIDELPQFVNVLRGDMSIVGPRPERPYFVGQFSEAIPFYNYRHLAKPGITGWAQVNFRYGASLDDAKRKLSYDLFYIRNRSVLLDLVILLKTVGVVLRGDGAR